MAYIARLQIEQFTTLQLAASVLLRHAVISSVLLHNRIIPFALPHQLLFVSLMPFVQWEPYNGPEFALLLFWRKETKLCIN